MGRSLSMRFSAHAKEPASYGNASSKACSRDFFTLDNRRANEEIIKSSCKSNRPTFLYRRPKHPLDSRCNVSSLCWGERRLNPNDCMEWFYGTKYQTTWEGWRRNVRASFCLTPLARWLKVGSGSILDGWMSNCPFKRSRRQLAWLIVETSR